jgi:acyl-homoserine lactone acylase PvdQ
MKLAKSKEMSRRLKAHWWTRRNRIFLVGAAALVMVLLMGFALARHTVRRGWPQSEGVLTVVGLDAPVTVVRDHYGVPHIYAGSETDLFFAQGYVHAQDRFWQMELERRRGRGTLAALLGEGAQASDERWRNLDLADVAARELAEMDAATRTPLDAYAAGVNAWLGNPQGRLPFEFTLTRWRGRAAGDPAPWSAEDSLIVSLALGWQAGAQRVDPSLAARIVERVGPERGVFLLGAESDEASLQAPTGVTDTLPGRWALSGRVTLVGGDRTKSGEPLFAADLPTDLGLPAPWYVMAWHVGLDGVAGASVPGLPGLLVGTDDGAAWEAWLETQELALREGTPPWKRWLLAALLNTGGIVQADDEQATGSLDDFQTRLMDTRSARAARLIPFLVGVEPEGWRQERVTGMLRKWDYQVGDNNKEAPFFVAYQLELARAAFADELGDALFEAYAAQSDRYQAALDRIVEDPDDEWWDDVTTPGRELRGDILKRAYEPALEWIGRNYGDLHMLWEWNIVHSSRLHHPLGDAWPWDQLLSRDLAPDGWADTVNASPGGLPCTGGICLGGDFYRARAVYGYRQVLDASDPSTLWFMLLPGQSGHPFHPHYDDLLDEWLAGEYLPLRLAASPAEVEGAESVLILTPQDWQDADDTD